MKLFSTIVLLIFVALAAAAQSPSKVLKNAEKALGGKKRLAAVQTWERKGTVTRRADGSSGSFTQLSRSPGLYYVGMDLDGFETEMGFNGRSGWSRDSRSRLSTLTGDRSVDCVLLVTGINFNQVVRSTIIANSILRSPTRRSTASAHSEQIFIDSAIRP